MIFSDLIRPGMKSQLRRHFLIYYCYYFVFTFWTETILKSYTFFPLSEFIVAKNVKTVLPRLLGIMKITL